MAEASNTERREPKTRDGAARRTRANTHGSRSKTQAKSPSKLTPFIIAGASVGVAALAALALAANHNRRRPRRAKPEEPSFIGTLLRTTALSAARVLTTHLVQNKLLPNLPASIRSSDEAAL